MKLRFIAIALFTALAHPAYAQIVYGSNVGISVGINPSAPTGPLTVFGGAAITGSNGAPITFTSQQGGGPNGNGGDIIFNLGNAAGTGTPGALRLNGQQPEIWFHGTFPNATDWNIREQETLSGIQIETGSGSTLFNITPTLASYFTNSITAWKVDNSGNETLGGKLTTGGLGTISAMEVQVGSNAATGLYAPSTGTIALCGNGNCSVQVAGGGNASLSSPDFRTKLTVASTLIISETPPTIASGGCTTGSAQSISAAAGSAAFAITLGGATCGSTITLTLPSASHGWVCDAHDITTPASNTVEQSAGGSATSVTLTNYSRTTGLAANFTGADVLATKCMAY